MIPREVWEMGWREVAEKVPRKVWEMGPREVGGTGEREAGGPGMRGMGWSFSARCAANAIAAECALAPCHVCSDL